MKDILCWVKGDRDGMMILMFISLLIVMTVGDGGFVGGSVWMKVTLGRLIRGGKVCLLLFGVKDLS
jgi:hypothetical protein